LVLVLIFVVGLEVAVEAVGRRWWPSLIEVWQELEGDEGVKTRLGERGGVGGYGIETG
jgi:hypothetical protein